MSVSMWKEQIEKVKVDPEYTEEEKKNIIANYELFIWQENYDAEKKARAKARAKARSLAKQIIKMKAKIATMQKELGEIFYNDEIGRPFSHSERVCDPKNEKIRDALRLRMEE